MTSCKLTRQPGLAIASEGGIEKNGGATGETGDDVIECTSSLVALEEGVFCLTSSGGAISGSVRTPFFCSGEFFASGPLPSLGVADVVKQQLPY